MGRSKRTQTDLPALREERKPPREFSLGAYLGALMRLPSRGLSATFARHGQTAFGAELTPRASAAGV
jgi:hypothetical protein